MVTLREMAGVLALVCNVYRDFVTFLFGVLGQVWYLIVCYFYNIIRPQQAKPSSGFPTKRNSDQSHQLQTLATELKFRV